MLGCYPCSIDHSLWNILSYRTGIPSARRRWWRTTSWKQMRWRRHYLRNNPRSSHLHLRLLLVLHFPLLLPRRHSRGYVLYTLVYFFLFDGRKYVVVSTPWFPLVYWGTPLCWGHPVRDFNLWIFRILVGSKLMRDMNNHGRTERQICGIVVRCLSITWRFFVCPWWPPKDPRKNRKKTKQNKTKNRDFVSLLVPAVS